jgi:3-oxoacyl-[acyl-carrier protein] reductase
MSAPLSAPLSAPVALISGGSRGLGFETAKALAAAGFDLVLIAKSAEGLEKAKAALTQSAGRAIEISTFAIDLENPDAVRAGIDAITSTNRTPQVMVLAHGVMSAKMSKTLKTDDAEWRRVMAINLDSVFQLVNGIAPAMVEARDGRIVIYSACLGRMSGPGNAGGLAPYRISKAGVNALVRNLAHETGLGARGILVDAICPNHSQTDMGGPDAPRTAAEGAATAIWLATREFNAGDRTGVLWEDNQIVPW